MNQEIPGTLLLDPKVIEDPYPFYRQLHSYAPVWRVPGTEVFVVSSFALLMEAATRIEDFHGIDLRNSSAHELHSPIGLRR